MAERILLVDTPSLYFRAFYGVPQSVTAPDGRPVNAVRGLLDTLSFLIIERRATRLVATMDADWRPAFRVAALPSYKAHRVAEEGAQEEIPDLLSPQVVLIERVLAALGIACFGVEGFEADDVLATLAAGASCPAEVVTGDRDLFQVIDDSRSVAVLYVGRGVTRYEMFDEGAVAAKYGIPPRSYADFATLRGDPSDGLPGVAGVGPKTAAELITRFGSVENLLSAADRGDPQVSSGVRTKLAAARDYLAAAPVVVTAVTDVPLPAYDDRLPASPRNPEALLALVDELGISRSMERLLAALSAAADSAPY